MENKTRNRFFFGFWHFLCLMFIFGLYQLDLKFYRLFIASNSTMFFLVVIFCFGCIRSTNQVKFRFYFFVCITNGVLVYSLAAMMVLQVVP